PMPRSSRLPSTTCAPGPTRSQEGASTGGRQRSRGRSDECAAQPSAALTSRAARSLAMIDRSTIKARACSILPARLFLVIVIQEEEELVEVVVQHLPVRLGRVP